MLTDAWIPERLGGRIIAAALCTPGSPGRTAHARRRPRWQNASGRPRAPVAPGPFPTAHRPKDPA
jgi:hypothetical protein